MKLSGSKISFFGKFLIIISISLLVTDLLRFSVSLWFSFGRVFLRIYLFHLGYLIGWGVIFLVSLFISVSFGPLLCKWFILDSLKGNNLRPRLTEDSTVNWGLLLWVLCTVAMSEATPMPWTFLDVGCQLTLLFTQRTTVIIRFGDWKQPGRTSNTVFFKLCFATSQLAENPLKWITTSMPKIE